MLLKKVFYVYKINQFYPYSLSLFHIAFLNVFFTHINFHILLIYAIISYLSFLSVLFILPSYYLGCLLSLSLVINSHPYFYISIIFSKLYTYAFIVQHILLVSLWRNGKNFVRKNKLLVILLALCDLFKCYMIKSMVLS